LEWIHKHIGPFGGSSTEITLYGESAGSLATESQMHSLLPARFSRVILQSQELGAPLVSTPESIATKDWIYTKTKVHLNAKSVKELQEVPWQDLLTAYNASDPRTGLAHVPMIDGLFFDENWRSNYQFARGRSGTVLLGNTAAEGAVVTLVLAAAPKPASPPPTSALITALQSVITGEKLAPLINAYGLLDSTPVKEVKKNLLLLVEDMMWNSPTQELATILTSPHPNFKTPVYQYTFAQPNPFSGPFKGVPAHALDLAYLHGDPLIFEGLDQSEKDLQEVMKGYWIEFADGERLWDEGQMWSFGPGGQRSGTELEVFLKVRKEKWGSFGGLTHAEQEGVVGAVMGHLAQMKEVE
jgi:carboxylesterase type B